MGIEELREHYISDIPIYKALGVCVTEKILSELKKMTSNIDEVLQIPPKPRVKDTASFINKAFNRDKNYDDPYNDITDKVGTRFVVLLNNQIKLIDEIIEQKLENWRFSKDRDHISERLKSPELFIYQSDHYIVRPTEDIVYNGIRIPAETPCEVQVRTILQHAYSQLSHDMIYKPSSIVTKKMRRCLARSMALMETTDDIFIQAYNDMVVAVKEETKILEFLLGIYNEKIAPAEIIPSIDSSFIDALYKDEFFDEIVEYYTSGNGLNYFQLVKEERINFDLFLQPSSLLIIFLLDKKRIYITDKWSFSEDVLSEFCRILGIAYDPIS